MTRKPRILPVVLLAGALAACEGASRNQGGDPDSQKGGGSPEQGQGTIINDTTPHRPGAPDPAAAH
jgi:hypothetical protein